MFDPLANFKLNKIKKGVDGVKAAVDALPTSLSSSFTDVKNAISGVSTKVDGVDTKVDGVSTGVSNIAGNTADLSKILSMAYPHSRTSNVYTSRGNSGVGNVTIFDVSGVGVLDYALVSIFGWEGFTLTIDGKSIVFENELDNSVAISGGFIISRWSPHLFYDINPNSPTELWLMVPEGNTKEEISTSSFSKHKSFTKSLSGTVNFNNTCFTAGCIYFESNLKLVLHKRTNNASGSRSIRFGYTLLG